MTCMTSQPALVKVPPERTYLVGIDVAEIDMGALLGAERHGQPVAAADIQHGVVHTHREPAEQFAGSGVAPAAAHHVGKTTRPRVGTQVCATQERGLAQ